MTHNKHLEMLYFGNDCKEIVDMEEVTIKDDEERD